MKKNIIILAILIIALIPFIFLQKTNPYKIETVRIGDYMFTALVSDTEELRELGLSGRKGLGVKEAMLFVFDKPAFYGFWMKDMLFSIDMVWLDENFHVVSFEKNVSPRTYPKSFTPTGLSKYVIELSSGTVDRLNLKIGDQVIISGGK